MTKCHKCNGEEFKPVFDCVPYGSIDVPMQTGEVCINCGEDQEEE